MKKTKEMLPNKEVRKLQRYRLSLTIAAYRQPRGFHTSVELGNCTRRTESFQKERN